MNIGMLNLSTSSRSLVEVELAHLYKRRSVVDQLIGSLERYAKVTNTEAEKQNMPTIVIETKLAS